MINLPNQNAFEEGFMDRRSKERAAGLTVNKIIFSDFILLTAAFFVCHFFKRGHLSLDTSSFSLLFGIYGCWLAASVIAKKFSVRSYLAYGDGVLVFIKSACY